MILVTGASGFLGQHLVRYLSAQQLDVRALYHNTPPNNALTLLPNVTWMQCDLLDVYDVADAMQGIQEVYHCAGMVSFNPEDKEALLHFNVESTANVVNEALEQQVRKLVFASSVAALGRNQDKKEITEEEEWEESRHSSVYGMSKYLAEMEVWRGIAEGLTAAIVNPTVILGESNNWNKGSARLIKVADEEFPFYTEGINGWVDVQDVVKAMYLLMQSDIEAERFIVCEGCHTYKDIFTKMAVALNRKPPRIKATPFMIGIVWRWNMLKHLLFGKEVTVTKETAATASRITLYNNSKLIAALPAFSYTEIDTTILRMAQAYREDFKK